MKLINLKTAILIAICSLFYSTQSMSAVLYGIIKPTTAAEDGARWKLYSKDGVALTNWLKTGMRIENLSKGTTYIISASIPDGSACEAPEDEEIILGQDMVFQVIEFQGSDCQ